MKGLISLGIAGLLSITSPSFVIAQSTSPSLENVDLDNQQVSASKLALIQELRTLMKSDENTDKIFAQMRQQTQQQIKEIIAQYMQAIQPDTSIPPEVNNIIEETITRVTKRFDELMDSQINIQDFSEKIDIYIYNKYYSEAELQDLITFYKTDTGQKVASILPEIQADSSQLFNQNLMPKIIEFQTQILTEELEKLQQQIEKTMQ